VAQDDYYYEIQLTNKQLVFYFMAAAAGLIFSFLAGVTVGRHVDAPSTGDTRTARVQDERVVPEETPKPVEPSPTQDLGYARRLEGERRDEGLGKPEASPAAVKPTPAAPSPIAPPPSPSAETTPKPVRSPKPSPSVKATPTPRATPTPATASVSPVPASPSPRVADASPRPVRTPEPSDGATGGSFTIQVGAFKEKPAAESVAKRLKSKGFPAYVNTPEGSTGGLFNVRVGSYVARADAERVQERLRDQEKFKPFIVKN